MTRGSLKIGQGSMIRAHFETLVDVRTGNPRFADYAIFVCVPVACGLASFYLDVRLTSAAAAGLLTSAGLLSVFFFGVMLQVTDRAMNWADTLPARGRATSKHARDLKGLAANAGFASLVCVLAAVAFVVAATTGHEKLRIASGVAVGLGVMVIVVLLLVMRRVYNLTVSRLTDARTGEDVAPRN